VVARQVRPRRLDERRELSQQLDAGHDEVGAAVRQRALHLVAEASVGQLAQAAVGERAARTVVAQALEAFAVPGAHAHGGM